MDQTMAMTMKIIALSSFILGLIIGVKLALPQHHRGGGRM